MTSMQIERLKELKNYVGDMSINTSAEFNIQLDILSLIDAEISRQQTTAPTLEEIQRVTTWMIEMRKTFAPEIYTDSDRLCAAIIAALQQHAPKEPCKWCKEVNGFMRLDSVRYSRCDEIGYDHDVQFPRCPNCGRELKAGE